jgi:hypothetical protein
MSSVIEAGFLRYKDLLNVMAYRNSQNIDGWRIICYNRRGNKNLLRSSRLFKKKF